MAEQVLFDIVVTLAVAVVLGMTLQRLGQSVVIGYLLAGVLLGPGAFGVVESIGAFSTIAELGVALLLFTIGLELSWKRIARGGRFSALAGLVQLALTIAVATPITMLTGLDWRASLVIAMAIALSSTAVVLRVLAERAELDSVHGLGALSVLLVQDIATVAFLLLLPQLAGEGTIADVFLQLGIALLKIIGLIIVMYLVDLLLIRRLFHQVTVGPERDLLAIMSIVISLGAAGATDMMELSPALGAFVAGILLGEAPYADQVRAEVAPLRTATVALFFAWVGLFADLAWIADNILPVVAVVVAVMLGKSLLSTFALVATGHPRRASLLAGLSLAQLGEFSFVLLTVAHEENLITADAFQFVVSVSLFTLLLTPYVINAGVAFVNRRAPRNRRSTDLLPTHPSPAGMTGHAVVVGYGPSGKEVVRALRQAGVPVVIIELNARLENVPEDGVEVLYGDASRAEILFRAGISSAVTMVVTVPDAPSQRRVITQARSLSETIVIIARVRYHIFYDQINEAGATRVVDEETETGRLLATETLRAIGLSP